MFAPFIMKVMAYCGVSIKEQDVVAVATNAEQVTEQKNLNKWPQNPKNTTKMTRIMVATFM
jgi:hypothetical protein